MFLSPVERNVILSDFKLENSLTVIPFTLASVKKIPLSYFQVIGKSLPKF